MTDTTVPSKVTGDTVTADEFNDLVDAVNSKADDPVTVSAISDADEAASGVIYGTAFQAVIDAGGAAEATLAGIIATLADSGGEQVPPAEETDHWENTQGLILATPQSLSEAEVEQDITPSSGSITLNGAQGWNWECTITEASDIAVISNLTAHVRRLCVTATGGSWDLGFTAGDVLINIETNVNIIENKTATFFLWANSTGDNFIYYAGQQDSAGGGGSLSNIVEDVTPQLGGNLDLNSFTVGDATAADLTKLHELTATSTELNYVDGVTSAIQTQLDAKQTANADLTSLVTNWVQASASGASSLDFHEDTDNGTNRVRLIGPASTADVTVTLPAVTGTLLTGAAAEGAAPTFNTIEVGTSQTDTTISRASAGQIAVEGVNVLMNGGALGTPSSGTLTNCTFEIGNTDTTLARGAAGQITVEGIYVQLAGTTNVYTDATAWVAATTSGAEPTITEMTTNKQMVSGFAFDTSADEYAHIKIVLPKRWNISTVTYRVHWTQATTNATATVTWCMEGLATSNDDTMDAAWGTAVRVVDDGGTGYDEYLSDASGALTLAGTPAAADMLFFRLSRDVDGNGTAGNDDLAQDAIMLGVEFTITTNAATDA